MGGIYSSHTGFCSAKPIFCTKMYILMQCWERSWSIFQRWWEKSKKKKNGVRGRGRGREISSEMMKNSFPKWGHEELRGDVHESGAENQTPHPQLCAQQLFSGLGMWAPGQPRAKSGLKPLNCDNVPETPVWPCRSTDTRITCVYTHRQLICLRRAGCCRL